MTENRVYTSGEQPKNPIIRDMVYIIDDIRAEPPHEPTEEGEEPIPCYSYIVVEKLTLGEYFNRVREEQEEALREIDEAIFELDAGGEA